MLTFWIIYSVSFLFLYFLFLRWHLHYSSFQLSFLLRERQRFLTGTWRRDRLSVLIVASFMTEHGLVILVTLILFVVPISGAEILVD